MTIQKRLSPCRVRRRTQSLTAAFAAGLMFVTLPAVAEDSDFGHERAACSAWDIQLRYILGVRQQQATLSLIEGEVILDEVMHASRLCQAGRFRTALDRFAALYDLLSGESEEREEQG
jgi:hypothetical protein